jgi:serine protease AprX
MEAKKMNAIKTKLTSKSGPLRRAISMLLFGAAAAAALWAIVPPRALSQSHAQDRSLAMSKIAPWVLQQTADGKQAEFLVVLTDQADLSGAAALRTKQEKGRYVRDALLNKAQATQGPILTWLRQHNIEHRSYYIVNFIWVKANRDVALELAGRPDVLRVEGNPVIHNFRDMAPAVPAPSQPQRVTTIEPGIAYTHAPDVWALGYTGQGIVVGGADTGYRWTHNALKPHYRGWDGTTADHDYNWHDSIHDSTGNPCGNDSPFPCDDFGHGSHTMGTAIGDDGMGNQIGMAPGAKWIGCRNMDEGNGTPTRYMECFQFFLAPYPVGGDPSQGDPTLAPHVTTNSWTCPPSEGCSADTLQMGVEAQRAAGIIMVVAAENYGSDCSTVREPPGIYAAAYSIGALNTGTDTIASFSSRGPVTVDGSNRLKPDLSAPGTNTRSAYNTSDSAYAFLSGTSMATPHVAGGMALILSSNTSLIHDWATSEGLMSNNAVHILNGTCDGGPPVTPNNTYGYGRIDVLAAAQQALLLPQLNSAVSRRTHGAAGTFDIDLPLSGQPGVECRSTGGNYTEVFTFNTDVVSGSAAVTGGIGSVSGSPTFSGDTMTVNLTGVADVQKITVMLTNVTDPNGRVLPQVSLSMNVLIGDVNANKTVNASDVALVKSQVGQVVSSSNFREDVNDDGSLSSSDVALTKSKVGNGVP